jgi:hypothetical protein
MEDNMNKENLNGAQRGGKKKDREKPRPLTITEADLFALVVGARGEWTTSIVDVRSGIGYELSRRVGSLTLKVKGEVFAAGSGALISLYPTVQVIGRHGVSRLEFAQTPPGDFEVGKKEEKWYARYNQDVRYFAHILGAVVDEIDRTITAQGEQELLSQCAPKRAEIEPKTVSMFDLVSVTGDRKGSAVVRCKTEALQQAVADHIGSDNRDPDSAKMAILLHLRADVVRGAYALESIKDDGPDTVLEVRWAGAAPQRKPTAE